MFAPITAAVKSATQARESASRVQGNVHDAVADTLHAAESLVERVRAGDGPKLNGGGNDGDDGEDDETPQEAEDRIDAEYRPLLNGEDDAEGSRGKPTRTAHSRSQSYEDRMAKRGGEPIERKSRALEVGVTYVCFFILGAVILLGWNTSLVASEYFGSRLKGSRFELSYSSWVALTFTTANLVFLAIANITQHGANLGRRIYASITILIVVVALYTTSTQIHQIPTGLFFGTLLICTVTLAGSASYLQNAVVALSASFGPTYLQGILSGQGAVAFFVSAIQFVAAYASISSTKTLSSSYGNPASSQFLLSEELRALDAPIPSKGVRQAAFSFFLTVGGLAVVSLLAFVILTRMPLYRLVIRASQEDDDQNDDESSSGQRRMPKPSLRTVERKIRKLGVSIFFVFGITLSVFPSITSTIVSVHKGEIPAGGGISEILTQTAVFLPVAFMTFAIGDWLGRILPQIKLLTFTDWRALAAFSAARMIFIPLFLMCNTSANKGTPVINSDIAFLVIMLVFSLTNGYASTLLMLAAVVEPSLEEHEVDVAATCMAFYLTAGLAGGSFLSFPIRALALK